MKNTLEKGQFRILIYKRHNEYVGICYETGWVEVYSTKSEVLKHITNGIESLLKTTLKHNFGIENINRRPPLKYCLIFHTLPILATFKKIWYYGYTCPS